MFFSYSVESGVIYLFQHLGLLISHSPGSFFQDSAVGSLEEAGILHKWYCYQHNSQATRCAKSKPPRVLRQRGLPQLHLAALKCAHSLEVIRERRALLNSGLMCL